MRGSEGRIRNLYYPAYRWRAAAIPRSVKIPTLWDLVDASRPANTDWLVINCRASGFWLLAGLTCSVAVSSPTRAQVAARPEYKSLRFDEVWTASHRSPHWDDVIKAMPLWPGKPVTLTVGGQARWRVETFRAFNLTTTDDDHSQSRLLLSADLRAGHLKSLHGRVFAEMRDAQSYGRTLPGAARPSDADRHDAQNLFADLAHGASFVRYGRQEIALNRERQFGVPDWANTRRGAQGTRAMLVVRALSLDLIDARPVVVRQTAANRADSTARFRVVALGSAPGAKALARGLPALWQGYWVEQVLTTSATPTRRLTSGGRTMWQWGLTTRRAYSVELEGAIQKGHTGDQQLDGWFLVAESQVTWRQVRGAPSLALGIETASGDRASTSSRLEGFAALYPAAHAHGGFVDVFGRTNLRELHAIGTWDPVKSVALRAAVYRFDRIQLDDGVYTKQNTLFRASALSRDRHAGNELDVTGTWKATRHWRGIFGASIVTPGAFLLHTAGGAHTEHWAFAGTSFTF